ncbi:MAG: YgjV family protein, partial [Rubrivivax sp.]
VVIVAANIGFGVGIADKPSDWLPLGASCLGTIALFTLQGIPMRLLMLCGTGLWIANNLIVGSIGGTALEIVIAVINLSTIARMLRSPPGPPAARTPQ